MSVRACVNACVRECVRARVSQVQADASKYAWHVLAMALSNGSGQKLAAAVGINITEPVPLPMPHARLSSFDDQGERRPSHADKNGAADGLGGANGAGGAADAPSALDLEAAALGLAPMMDGEESLGGSVSLLSFGASGAGTGRTEGMQTKVLLTKENKTLLDPMSMTPPQKRRFGTKLAAMTSPSVQTLLRDKDRSTKQYKAAIEKATVRGTTAPYARIDCGYLFICVFFPSSSSSSSSYFLLC